MLPEDHRRIDKGLSGNCFKTVSSRLFYRLMNFLSDVTVTEGCADFRLLDRKVIEVLRGCREEYLFLRGMVSWVGFHRIQIPYQARMRYAGTTKYSLKKMILFAVCGITSFSIRPLRWAILFAAFFALLSITEIIYVLYAAFYFGAGCDRLGISGYTDFCVGGSDIINARYYRRVFG